MAITFDSSKIAMFRDAQFASGNTIANLGDDGLTAGGTYHGALGAITRTKAEKAENNKVRTELLRSLGQAFGLSGMSEADGKVSFSKDFMDQLESILGKDVFKRADFNIGADGTVTSGRPLTSRRISAIMTKAVEAGEAATPQVRLGGDEYDATAHETATPQVRLGGDEYDAAAYEAETPLVRLGGGEYDAAAYDVDLDTIQHDIAKRKDTPPAEETKPVLRLAMVMEDEVEPAAPEPEPPKPLGPDPELTDYFNHVGMSKAFLDKDFEGLISENEEWVRNDQSGKSNQGVPRYVITDPKTQARLPLRSSSDLVDYFTHTNKIGLFEPSLYSNIPKGGIKTPEGLKALKDYVRSTLKTYVQSSIDLYFEAKEAGKLEDFVAEIVREPGACMDGKANRLGEIREALGLLTDVVPEVADHDERTNLDMCVFREIGAASKKIPTGKVWKDLADAVKQELVGKIRPICTVENGKLTPLMEGGKPVVRAVTAEDVDRIGPTCMEITGAF